VLLAGLSADHLTRYFARAKLVPLTDRTVTDPARLRRLVDECRADGYSAVEDELAYGVVAVAVPVFDQAGTVVAALNSSGHSKRISRAKLVRERLKMLQDVSRRISTELRGVSGLSLSAQR
jgi:IclR family pca regulon transcriptional regulator